MELRRTMIDFSHRRLVVVALVIDTEKLLEITGHPSTKS